MARKYPFRRRRRNNNNKKTLTKKNIYRNRGSLGQAKQISLLDKKLTRLTKDTIQKIYYKYGTFTDDPGNVYMNQWVIPSVWDKIFNSQQANELQQSCYLRRITGETLVQIANQAQSSPFTCSFFVVTLKSKTATQFLVDTNGGQTLVEGEHYTNVSLTDAATQGDGLVYMNKDIFNIHKCVKFQLSESPFYQSSYPTDSTYVTSLKDTNKRIKWSVNYNKRLRSDNSGTGDVGWKILADADIAGKDKVFTYLFTNGVLTSELSVGTNVLFQIETVK